MRIWVKRRELRLPKALRKGDMEFPTYRQAGLLIADTIPSSR
ncbi:hypothetical protein [Brucella suis]